MRGDTARMPRFWELFLPGAALLLLTCLLGGLLVRGARAGGSGASALTVTLVGAVVVGLLGALLVAASYSSSVGR